MFRVGSITALHGARRDGLEEVGLVDLDAPASEYLRAYRLIPAHPSSTQVTLRHLLTHRRDPRGPARPRSDPSGGGAIRGPPLVLSAAVRTAAAVARRVLPRRPPDRAPARDHVRLHEPRLRHARPIVEDVTGMSLAAVYASGSSSRSAWKDTDLVRSERIAARLAIGYTFGAGAEPVPTATDRRRGQASLLHPYGTWPLRRRSSAAAPTSTDDPERGDVGVDVRLQPPARPRPQDEGSGSPGATPADTS